MIHKPKRPMSCYNLWLNSMRERIMSENPGASNYDLCRLGGQLWKSLKDKTEWQEKSAKAREQYAKDLKSYISNVNGGNGVQVAKFARLHSPKKSKQSGASADDGRFNKASCVRNVKSGRKSFSNLDLSKHKPLPAAEEVSDCTLDNRNKSTDPESTVATTVNERRCEALRNKKAATMKNEVPPKKQNKIYTNCQESVSQLPDIVDSTVYTKDAYKCFALHIAAQLRKLPDRSFIILQDQIQSIVTKERLKYLT